MPLSDSEIENIANVNGNQNVKGYIVHDLVAALKAARTEAFEAKQDVADMRDRAAAQAGMVKAMFEGWYDFERAAICEDIRLRILALK